MVPKSLNGPLFKNEATKSDKEQHTDLGVEISTSWQCSGLAGES
jgi:hypothetical protein